MTERTAIDAAGVSKRFGDRDALVSVDLRVERGGVHGLLGPNGAGKTTLMRVLLGLIRRDSGTVRLLGREMGTTTASLPDGVAGFVETPAFYPYLSGRANLALLARLDTTGASPTRIAAVLEEVGLSAHADARVGGYSAGMRQRLAIASALLRAPALVLLDEPTSSLDIAGARDIRALVRRLADEGAAVLLSSHDMTEVDALCASVTVINAGRVVCSGPVDAVKQLAPAAVHLLRTSDDDAALSVARRSHELAATRAADGLELVADTDALDAYVIALGRAGVAVRALERRARALESLVLDLTAGSARSPRPGRAPSETAESEAVIT